MQRRSLWAALGGAALSAVGIASAAAAKAAKHRMALHVGSGDPVMMQVALHNIAAAAEAYAARGETAAIELVANGPGYMMMRADKSPVKDQLAATKRKYPFVVFSACQNTRRGMAAAEGKQPQDIPELPEVTDVQSGVVRLAELQAEQYAYIRV